MLTSLAFIFLAGMAMGWVFKKIRLPALLGMLIAGIWLGPFGFNMLDESILTISSDLRKMALIRNMWLMQECRLLLLF